MFCTNCGKALQDGDNFCPHCGKACKSDAADLYRNLAAAEKKVSGKLNMKLLMRSILSLFALIAPGIVGILFTLRASKATEVEKETRCLRIAKIATRIGIGILAVAAAGGLIALFSYVISGYLELFKDLGIDEWLSTARLYLIGR